MLRREGEVFRFGTAMAGHSFVRGAKVRRTAIQSGTADRIVRHGA